MHMVVEGALKPPARRRPIFHALLLTSVLKQTFASNEGSFFVDHGLVGFCFCFCFLFFKIAHDLMLVAVEVLWILIAVRQLLKIVNREL